MNNEIFENYPIPKAIKTLALPTIMGMLINIIYNMADTFFVGQTKDANQVAAVTITMPIFLLLLSFGNIFAIGGGAYISRLLGEKEYAKIKNASSVCFYLSILVGIIFGIVSLYFIDPILKNIGTNNNTYEFAKSYVQILALGAPFVCLQTALSGIIRSEGSSKQSMIGMMIGTIINIILDPIMILGMNMGVKGAAIATVIGNIASCIYYIIYSYGKKTYLSIALKNISFEKSILKNIFVIGIPVSINTILISFSNIILNNYAEIYGNDVLAAIGIANRINTISIMLFLGLSQGSQPFIGYNYAAKNYDRMKESIKFTIKISVLIGTSLLISILLLSEYIVTAFIKDPSVIEYGKYFTKAAMSVAPILGICFIFMSTFQATGKGLPALLISISRQGIAFIPAIVIGNKLFGLNGVVWAQPFADFTAVIMATLIFISLKGKLGINKNKSTQ